MDANQTVGNRHERRRQEAINRRQGADADGEARGGHQARGDMESQAKESVADIARSVQQSAKIANDLFRRSIEERPYTTAVAALGIGWLMGRMGR